jgi:hypothetical protein
METPGLTVGGFLLSLLPNVIRLTKAFTEVVSKAIPDRIKHFGPGVPYKTG